MLKYFKKQKFSKRVTGEVGVGTTVHNADLIDGCDAKKRDSLRSSSSFCDEVFLEELIAEEDATSMAEEPSLSNLSIGCTTNTVANEEMFCYNSRLSMSLPAIVTNPNCLSYFVQYLETKEVLSLIKFYLDTENFKEAALLQLENKHFFKHPHSQVNVSTQNSEFKKECKLLKDPVPQRQLNQSDEEDYSTESPDSTIDIDTTINTEEQSSVPELKTLCDLSMRKPLTDDEKSRIYAEANKHIKDCSHKLSADSELSLCSVSTNTTETDKESRAHLPVSAASVRDALTIYQKYLIANAKHFVSLPVSIISQISLLLCKCDETITTTDLEVMPVSAHCFDEAQQYVLQKLEQQYLNEFLQSTFFCRYCIELIERGHTNTQESTSSMLELNEEELNIYDILYSEVTLFFFMEFLEQQHERECLDFWSAAVNFRKSYSQNPNQKHCVSELQADAMIIYDKFFSLQSESRLWLSDRLRSHVEECICAISNVSHCFDLPLRITAKYLERKYFDKFMKSQLFENYLNELKIRVHEEQAVSALPQQLRSNSLKDQKGIATAVGKQQLNAAKHTGRHRKTLSDCSNESRDLFQHISQHNTLLAMDSSNGGSNSSSSSRLQLKHLHSTGTSLNIDSRQLTNPNLLWRRANSTDGGGLKFGRINSLGRYERDFQTVDTTNKTNWSLSIGSTKFRNAVRKLVHLPEDKMQEEIAWQVAEMIVRDVTSVTLNDTCTNNKC